MENYAQLLRETAKKFNSIVCVGIDPDINKIPLEGKTGEVIKKYFISMLDAFEKENVMPGAVKPNYAFFSQYGIEGLQALLAIIQHAKSKGLPVILDAKRGDIGNTSTAYAKEAFEAFGADSLTVAPYMGSDSVQPFIEWSGKGKGLYVLNRTSNKGAVDFQNLEVSDGTDSRMPLWKKVSEKIVEWHQPGTGAVVGATYPDELAQISRFFADSGKEVPLLIPGVGAQGGSAQEAVAALTKTGNDLSIHRINSSRGIIYAYAEENEGKGTDDYAGAAVRALKKLNQEIGNLF